MDVLLRLGIAFAAGALFRMLQVFGVPTVFCFVGLAVAGAFLSWRLVASRIFVVLAVSAGHFLTYLMTQTNAAAAEVSDLPSMWTLAGNAIGLFLPFGLPALGSILTLRYEQKKDKEKKEAEELTVDSLLAEKPPQTQPPELAYELLDMKESADPR